MEEVYISRPFKTRNADEYNLTQILDLFVSPQEGLSTPFDYENNIIKGRMGSGKTMFLRANYAYYLYNIIPTLIEESELILPVFIRLSDFQHIQNPSDIYHAIIIKIIEELSSIYLQLIDAKKMANLHLGIKRIADDPLITQKMSSTFKTLLKLGSEEYVERISSRISLSSGLKSNFLNISATFQKENLIEIKQKPNPGINDIVEAYKTLLEDHEGKIILLIDEAGSLDRRFFRGDNDTSFFEILMNQFRTSDFIRTKIAIYPNSYQDTLTETRYGDVLFLDETVQDTKGYLRIRKIALGIIQRYVSASVKNEYMPDQIFDIRESDYGDALEQIIYASGGNLRRLIHLLDMSLNHAYAEHQGKDRTETSHVWDALRAQVHDNQSSFSQLEIEFLGKLASACKNRSTYRFTFPYMSPTLNKYASRSKEYNMINVVELGAGRRKTTYCFDFAFCVAHEIPTHYINNSERIDRERSLSSGVWINRVTTISEDILTETERLDKIEGTIRFFKGDSGFIETTAEQEYFFKTDWIIESDRNKSIRSNVNVRFNPVLFEDTAFATNIEILT